jgi:maleate isomerase
MITLPFSTDNGVGSLAKFGVVVLQTDEVIETEFTQFLPRQGIAVYHSRIPSGAEVTAETLSQMQYAIHNSLNLFPEDMRFDVIAYGCTSASAVIGETKVTNLVQQLHPNTKVTNPISATKAALHALSVKRIGFVSPYIPQVCAQITQCLEQDGFEITSEGSFNEIADSVVAKISEDSLTEGIYKVAAASDCDAIFVSCTNLRVANIIARTEATLGIPIVSSNQAMAWHMLQLANIPIAATQSQYGKLFHSKIPLIINRP